MPRRRSLPSQLFRAARVTDDVEAVGSDHPKRMIRRAKNITMGRLLAEADARRRL
jgi:hypothetical protein